MIRRLIGQAAGALTIAAATMLAAAPAAEAQTGPKAVVSVVKYEAGSAWKAGVAPADQDLKGHFGKIAAAFAAGELLANGPTLDDGRGFYIYNIASPKTATTIASTDPGVANNVLKLSSVETWQLFFENLGADIAGKSLYVLNYNPGPAWVQGKPLFEQNVGEHLKYVTGLFQSGALLAGGPVTDRQGRYIVAADNLGAAYALIGADPGVRDGVFLPGVQPWSPFNRQGYDAAASKMTAKTKKKR